MTVKFVDLAAQNREIREEVEEYISEIHAKTSYIGGEQINSFEREFATFLNVEHVVALNSGTDALRLALLAAGVGAGDEVLTVAMTFIATAEAIVQTGARPVFIEIDRTTRNISVAAVERYLAERRWTSAKGPRALLPVDLYGLPAASFELRKIADDNGLRLIEDACQAHGAKVLKGQDWVRAGSQADAAAFSFYPGKNLGGWGDGGAIATNDAEIAARVSALRDHGRVSHYAHSDLGYNARLDAIQAAVLRAKLRRLDAWNARRREIANRYREHLSDAAVELPEEPRGYESCYHLFTIRSPNRDRICDALTKADIQCGIHYPIPLHEQPACSFLGYKLGDFPVTEGLARSVMSLPMHPHLSDDEIFTISRVVRESAVRS